MDDTNGQVVAGANGLGNRLDQLSYPVGVLIYKETDSLIICDTNNRRVVRWSRRSGTTQGEILIENISCLGLAMDDQRYLYLSDYGKQEVRRYQTGDKNGTLVAGGNGKGARLNQLSKPTYIFVDQQQTVYVVSFDPRVRHTVWSLIIGGGLNALSVFGFNQTQVQRYMCVRTTRGARQALFINAVGNTLVVILCGIMGIIIYAYYVDCDPYTAKYISGIDQIFPYFVMEVLSDKKGLPGIFLACIFSGSLSTISSGVNSLAAVFIEDVYKSLMGRTLSDERQGFLSKILSIILGGVVMLLTYIVSYLGSVLNAALSLFGVLSGPIMGVFFLGFFFPKANSHGGFIGFLTSLCLQLWILLGAQLTKKQVKSKRLPLSVANCSVPINITTPITNPIKLNPLLDFYSISYLWYSPIALGTVITVGMIVSYLTRPVKPKEIDPKLIIPVSGICCFCLPKRIRDWLRCGFTDDDYLEKKVQNNNELIVPKGCNTIHTSKIEQTLGTNTIAIFPSGVVIRTTMNGAYDNPTIWTKD
ncbi:unnamed protein product [Rotaria sordida]|uniref:Uncharacterized protein n=1 Tax=Rotaria sordida TaxID=392033 RepID=A0A819TU22_9BILA|nr:unnamed protein product [Rotaria sordida]